MADQPLSDSDRNILETIEIITEYDKMLAAHPESKEVLTKLKRQIERVLLGHLEFKARYEPV
ncbi:MAG TPA: hypothetical protein VD736_04065 [Nitrososphaera sp.]|nr:hypothetical protein [Nitrososphaera sp.]